MEDVQSKPVSRVFRVVKLVFTWLVVAVAVAMMIFTIVAVTTFDRYDRNLFGYRAFIVTSDSMKASGISAGDIIISKEVDETTLQPGDIITFQSQDEDSFGEIVTHKIRRLTTTADGYPGFVTYGTTTDTDDETIVTYSFVLGKYQARLPFVGNLFQFLKTPLGYICCILIPFLILIGLQGLNCVQLFRKYKAEQKAELEAERAELEKQRAEAQEQTARMMAELEALKAQLAQQQTPPADEKPENDNDTPQA